MTDTIARTIAALREFPVAVAAELYRLAPGRKPPNGDDILVLCDAAEAGLRCPPREPTARMFIAGTKALLDADGSFARVVWNAMHDEWVNEGGQEAKGGGAGNRAEAAPDDPVPPSPDDACRWLRQSFPLTARERALIAATIQHLAADAERYRFLRPASTAIDAGRKQ